MLGMDLKNHFSLSSSHEVAQICDSALSSIGITYFNYIKIYDDGSRELLTNNSPWIDHFYKNALYKSVGAIDIEYLLPKGYFLWSELKQDDPAYEQGRETFNIDNGVSFVVKKNKETLLYIFGSSRDNYSINNFYVRNIDLFKRFILYFNDKASSLLYKASKNRIFLPDKQVIQPRKLKQIDFSVNKRMEFFDKTRIDRFFLLNQEKEVYLTRREAECMTYVIKGASAKQIAKILNISYRTVQSHIQNVREKLDCSRKDELENILVDSNISDVMF